MSPFFQIYKCGVSLSILERALEVNLFGDKN
jgi:hypothetical protein